MRADLRYVDDEELKLPRQQLAPLQQRRVSSDRLWWWSCKTTPEISLLLVLAPYNTHSVQSCAKGKQVSHYSFFYIFTPPYVSMDRVYSYALSFYFLCPVTDISVAVQPIGVKFCVAVRGLEAIFPCLQIPDPRRGNESEIWASGNAVLPHLCRQ